MPDTIAAIEHILNTVGDVDGIDETIFTEGMGEVPEGFLVAKSDVVELVVDAAMARRSTLPCR